MLESPAGPNPLPSASDQPTSFVPRKIRELLQDLKQAGFREIPGDKGSHRKYVHANYTGAVTVSGKIGDDAKKYQEKQVSGAIESVKP